MAMNKKWVNLKSGCFQFDFQDYRQQGRFLLLYCSITRHPWRYAKSAFLPSLAVRYYRQGDGEILTQGLELKSRSGNNLN